MRLTGYIRANNSSVALREVAFIEETNNPRVELIDERGELTNEAYS